MLQNTQISDGGGLVHSFNEIISVENLLLAWREFKAGKSKKKDVQEYELLLIDNILALYEDLKNKKYTHGGYHHFKIADPKPRDIHKASVRDRLVHHAIYRILYPYFAKRFIADSYSCQLGKGTHRAMNRFRSFAYKVSKNNTRTCWVLKCDIRKFFASIDHQVLHRILCYSIANTNTLWLLERVINSFSNDVKFRDRTFLTATRPSSGEAGIASGVGLPLGNLTSQLLVNIYMNEFDQFVKHELKQKFYIRYADDFVFLLDDRVKLEGLIGPVAQFLRDRLHLQLHPEKLFIKTIASGVDFLGWIRFPDHRVLRTASKKRMIRRLAEERFLARVESYRGLLGHGNTKKLRERYLSFGPRVV